MTLNEVVQTVYADESGYTGSDFLKHDSPVFVSVSTSISPAEARDILHELLGPVQDPEYKYNLFTKNKKRSDLLPYLFEYTIRNKNKFVVEVCCKRFALITIWLYYWLYPFLSTLGMQIHEGGFSRVLPHVVLFNLPKICGETFAKRVLRQFQIFMNDRQSSDAIKLFRIFEQGPLIHTREYNELEDMLCIPLRPCFTWSVLKLTVLGCGGLA